MILFNGLQLISWEIYNYNKMVMMWDKNISKILYKIFLLNSAC